MRMVPVLRSINKGAFQGVTSDMVPEDDVIALEIFAVAGSLLRYEERLPIETDEKLLIYMQEQIPRKKEYILELWEKMEDPSRVKAMAGNSKLNIEEVKQRLLGELKSKGSLG